MRYIAPVKKNKYLPFLALIAALLIFVWIKSNQGGDNAGDTSGKNVDINRTATVKYSRHARCRMDCRMIDESEVREIISKGVVNYSRIEENEKGKTYPLEGTTHDGQQVRIVVAPDEDELVIVTVIDLGKEWPCDCR